MGMRSLLMNYSSSSLTEQLSTRRAWIMVCGHTRYTAAQAFTYAIIILLFYESIKNHLSPSPLLCFQSSRVHSVGIGQSVLKRKQRARTRRETESLIFLHSKTYVGH
jgi:hypothetical protein